MAAITLPEEAWVDVEAGTEALLERWLVAVGDAVQAGQVVAEAVLVKTSYEITAPAAGVISAIMVAESDTFAKDAALAQLETTDGAPADPTPAPSEHTAMLSGAAGQVSAAPSAASSAAPSAPSANATPLSGLRGSIARAMTQAWQAPQVAMAADVDMSKALARRDALREALQQPKLSVTPLIVHATALTLKQHPRLNALLTEQGIEQRNEINLALAVGLDDGLVTPVIRNADQLSLEELHAQIQDATSNARSGSLAPSALQGGTFTISNLGMTGIDWFTPILNPPQIAILGVGSISERAVVRDGEFAHASIMTLTLVFDHRAIDGYPAALFLGSLKQLLEAANF
jgi:pyruvate/2-oxoglutarate dehydrogenase complex dihydrolipoamide acyltransferase (E2) component